MKSISESIDKLKSKEEVVVFANAICKDEQQLASLIQLVLKGDNKISPKAAYTMNYCWEANPDAMNPYLEDLANLLTEDVHDGIKRNIVRNFQFHPLPEELHGVVLNNCFNLLTDRNAAIAVRAFSMNVVDRLAETYPEIRQELIAYLESEMDYTTAAFKSRARKIIKKGKG